MRRRRLEFPFTAGSWPVAATAYLVPWFNGGCPWTMEFAHAVSESIPIFFAFGPSTHLLPVQLAVACTEGTREPHPSAENVHVRSVHSPITLLAFLGPSQDRFEPATALRQKESRDSAKIQSRSVQLRPNLEATPSVVEQTLLRKIIFIASDFSGLGKGTLAASLGRLFSSLKASISAAHEAATSTYEL